MSKINKVQVDNIIYDIEDASIPSWARENEKPIYNYEEIENLPVIPSKTSELENDNYYVSTNDLTAKFNGMVHIYNHKVNGDGRKVDLLVEHIQGGGYGGYEDDLYINHKNPADVRILEDGTGTLYYKGKEVADREYVDEKIADIEVDIEDIDLTDYATKEYVDEEISKIEITGGDIDLTDYATKEYVDEKIENIEISGGGSIVESSTVDTLPIGSVVMFNGDEIPDGYIELEDYLPTYSTEEQRIGTWIDGKPLYRKVLSLLSPNSKTLQTIDTGVTGIERFIKIEASIDTGLSASGVLFANYYLGSSSNFYVRGYGDKVQSFTSESPMLQKDMIIIIEYTKTTDERVG